MTTVKVYQKAKAGVEDILLGESTETQDRNGTEYLITKLNADKIPYSGDAVTNPPVVTIKDEIDAYDKELQSLTAEEIQQLQAIGSTTISGTQWSYLGELDQPLKTSDDVEFNTVNGMTDAEMSQIGNIGSTTISEAQWAYLGALDQNLISTSNVQFAQIYATDDVTIDADLIVNGMINGANIKAPVRVASTANLILASEVENGDTIDGVVVATNDRVLLKDQTDPIENGIYIVQASGAPLRATDADTSSELNVANVFVLLGTVNSGTYYYQTTANPTIGVSSIVWIEASAGNVFIPDGGYVGDPDNVYMVFDHTGNTLQISGCNVGIETSDVESWISNQRAIEWYGSAISAQTNADQISILSNAYHNGTSWTYKRTGPSAQIALNDGRILAYTAASGTGDTAITWNTPFQIEAGAPTNSLYVDSSGSLGLGTNSFPNSHTNYIFTEYPYSTIMVDKRQYHGEVYIGKNFYYDGVFRPKSNATISMLVLDSGVQIKMAPSGYATGTDMTSLITTPLTIDAGAPSDSVYVDSSGAILSGTSTPGNMAAGQMMLEGGALALKEIGSAPTADSGYFKTFGLSTDHQFYVQDDEGTNKHVETDQNAIIYRLNTDVINSDDPLGATGGEWEIADDTENESSYRTGLVNESNGIFSFTKLGIYKIFPVCCVSDTSVDNVDVQVSLQATDDNSTYSTISKGNTVIVTGGPATHEYSFPVPAAIIDVTSLTDCKVKLVTVCDSSTTSLLGNTAYSLTSICFERLGDT